MVWWVECGLVGAVQNHIYLVALPYFDMNRYCKPDQWQHGNLQVSAEWVLPRFEFLL